MKLRNKKIFCILILLSIIILITILLILNREQINNMFINKKSEELNKNITFQVYSNEDDILKILVIAKDTENGINKLIYFTEEGQQKEINCYGKTQVTLDYEVRQNGEYEFKIINQNNQEIIEKLIVDDNYRNNIISISVSTEKEIDIQGNVTIKYPENKNTTKMYRIGENGTWTEYTGEFKINSYDIIERNLQNSNTKKVDIYAKLEDNAKNIVQIKKEIEKIDVDIAAEPQINILSVDEYPTLTDEWTINNSVVSVNYDNRTDITNYYSIDNGKTWIEYTNELNIDASTVIAKSVKNNSGLEISKKEFINASGANALQAVAYDLDETTGIYYSKVEGTLTQYLNVDNSMQGKYINIIGHGEWGYHGTWCNIYFYDNSGKLLENYSYGGVRITTNVNENMLCPENCTKIKIEVTSSENNKFYLYEIRPAVVPKINYKFIYPTITSEGVKKPYENVVFEFFDNVLSAEYKINDGDWISYTIGDVIRLEMEETITVKAKYPRTVQTATRTAQYLSDALQPLAYDKNETTGIYYSGRDGTLTQYLSVDSSIQGKYINIIGYGKWNYYGTRCDIYFYDNSENLLEKYSYGGERVTTNLNENILCPENCTKIKIELTTHEYAKFYLYEIQEGRN